MRPVEYDTADLPTGSPILFFAIALAIGLLIGSERERNPSARAGLRTFALISLYGTLCAMLAEALESGWIVAIGMGSVAAMMVAAHRGQLDDDEPGTTTVIATLVTFGLGAMVWLGYPSVAVMLAITVTVLLYFKPELERASGALSRDDWISILRFAVVSLIVLPMLPDRGFGPYEALNPYNIWLMVVLISGIGLAGYLALRVFGTRHGALLLGVLGGLVSSTATTLVYARTARDNAALRPFASEVIVVANTMVLLRVALVTLLVAPALASDAATLLGPPFAVGLVAIVLALRRRPEGEELPAIGVGNPVGLWTSVSFAALYGAVLLAAAWLNDVFGSRGLFALAFVSGFTDVDAITLSTLRLHEQESVTARQAVDAIGLALIANALFKIGLLAFASTAKVTLRVGIVLAAMAIVIGAAILWP
jgi:uncharacterized membrane protein (DUF4010 family)